ncbi:MAG: hypothetical protein EA422_05260 [Gemmatimonadales bacterium]|nr:MAG: hypothetical protein EA422_05260 [Gemmatimonadales bacterium]
MDRERTEKNIGRILFDAGRITESDVGRALAHQRQEGGLFGEALVALGLVRPSEVDWGLASQYNLPYVFPDASAVDPSLARLVTVDWALAHTALPIARSGERITLVVDSPLKTEAARELEARAGMPVDLALGPAEQIRQAIRQVFGGEGQGGGSLIATRALSLDELGSLARMTQSPRWGISVREGQGIGWYQDDLEVRRYRLKPDWEAVLERILSPSPGERLPARGEGAWLAQIRQGGQSGVVEVRGISTSLGFELLLTPRETHSREADEVPGPDRSTLTELRLLLAAGALVLQIRSRPERMARELLPRLPGLVLAEGHRSLHLSRREVSSTPLSGVLTLPLEGPEGATARRLKELEEFCFDAVSVEVASDYPVVWPAARTLAPAVFVWAARSAGNASGEYPPPLPGVEWTLDWVGKRGGRWGWSLQRVVASSDLAPVEPQSTPAAEENDVPN